MRAELIIVVLIACILATLRLPPPAAAPSQQAVAAAYTPPDGPTPLVAAMRPDLQPDPYPLWVWPWGVLSGFVVVCCLYAAWWLKKEGFLPF